MGLLQRGGSSSARMQSDLGIIVVDLAQRVVMPGAPRQRSSCEKRNEDELVAACIIHWSPRWKAPRRKILAIKLKAPGFC